MHIKTLKCKSFCIEYRNNLCYNKHRKYKKRGEYHNEKDDCTGHGRYDVPVHDCMQCLHIFQDRDDRSSNRSS